MDDLWGQLTRDVASKIRQRDQCAMTVDSAERRLNEAEADLHDAHQAFLESRERLFKSFPELDRSASIDVRPPSRPKQVIGDPRYFRHAFDIEQVETSNLPLCRISEFAGHLGPCVKEKSDA